MENGYGCRTEFVLENAEARFIWVKADEQFYRAYKAKARVYEFCPFREIYDDKRVSLFGNKVLEFQDGIVCALVYHIDACFESETEMLADYQNFDGTCSFHQFLEDIVGAAG